MKLGLGRIVIEHLAFCPVFTSQIRKGEGKVRIIGCKELELIDQVVTEFL